MCGTKYIQHQLLNVRACSLDETGSPNSAKEDVTCVYQGTDGILGRPMIVTKKYFME